MKIIKSKNIRTILKNNWPNLKFIWPTDSQYIVMDFDELKDVVKKCSVRGFSSDGELWDCDNYALQLHAKVQSHQYKLNKQKNLKMKNSWAFGECIGLNNNESLFQMGNPPHAINIAITNNGIALIEPKDDSVWVAGKNEMSLFFVKF